MQSDGTSKVLHTDCRWSIGKSRAVDAFLKLLTCIFGIDVMKTLKNDGFEDHKDMMELFDVKLYDSNQTSSGIFRIKIPVKLRQCFEKSGKCITDAKDRANLIGKGKWVADKLSFDQTTFQHLLADALGSTIAFVQHILAHKACKGTDKIIMIGEFSQLPELQERVKDMYHRMRVMIPNEVKCAALIGAVIFGQEPLSVRARFTYGLGTNAIFDPKIHPENRKLYSGSDGSIHCRNAFSKHATKGEMMGISIAQSGVLYYPAHTHQGYITFPIYISDNTNPSFTDEPNSCQIGRLCIETTDVRKRGNGAVRVIFIFERKRIRLVAIDDSTKKFTEHTLQYPSLWMQEEALFSCCNSVTRTSSRRPVARRGKCPSYRHHE